MGKWLSTKNALLQVLNGLQLDGEAAFAQVLDGGNGEFDGYPGARILPGAVDSEQYSVGQRKRTIGYIVRIYMPLEGTNEQENASIDAIFDCSELVMDALDQADQDGTLNQIDNTIGTYIMNTTRGDIMESASGAGVLLFCDVNLTVEYLKNLT